MRRRPRLTGRGTIALVVAPVGTVGGLLLGAEEIALLGIAAATVVALGYLQCARRLARAADRWKITMESSSSDVPRWEDATLTARVGAEGGAGAVPVRLEDPAPGWEEIGHGASAPLRLRPPPLALQVRLPALAHGGTAALRFPIPTDDRGVLHLRGLRLWCFDGLGLFAGLVCTGPGATITVLPVPTEVPVAQPWLQGEREGDEVPIDAINAPRRRDNLGDFAGLRTYVPGDRLRLLYWPALARTGDLLVRDFEEVGPRRVHLLADVRAHLGSRGAESVLAAAAWVGLTALSDGALVEFETTTGAWTAIGPGPQAELSFLRAIAGVTVEAPMVRRRGRAPRALRPIIGPGLSRGALVVTTAGGAASLPVALRNGHVVIAS